MLRVSDLISRCSAVAGNPKPYQPTVSWIKATVLGNVKSRRAALCITASFPLTTSMHRVKRPRPQAPQASSPILRRNLISSARAPQPEAKMEGARVYPRDPMQFLLGLLRVFGNGFE